MTFDQVVVPAIQVVLASWVAMVTAGAGYLFIRITRLEHELADQRARRKAERHDIDVLHLLAQSQALSTDDDDET